MDSNNLNYAQPAPEPRKKGFGKATFLIIGLTIGVVLTCLIACIVMTVNSKKAPAQMEGAGYDSPEEAVEAYLNYLKDGDLDGVISTFAVESYVDNYDMSAYFERVQVYRPFLQSGAQLNGAFYFESDLSRELNIESRRAYILNGLYKQMLQIIICNADDEEFADEIYDAMMYATEDKGAVKDVMRFLSTDPELNSIEIDRFHDEGDYDLYEEGIKMLTKSLKKCWGSDIESVMVDLEIADEDYTLFMLCVCYDGKWYIAEFNNPVALTLGAPIIGGGLVTDEELSR